MSLVHDDNPYVSTVWSQLGPPATVVAMMTPAGIERKVRRLDEDLHAMYDMLTTISNTQRRHGERLDGVEERVIELDGKVSVLDRKVTDLDHKITMKFSEVDTKLDSILELVRGNQM
jgi:hypothetical protein